MGRSRSRSPQRKERRRSRSKDREREHRRHHRSRSHSPHRRSHSGSPYRAGSPDNDDVVFLGTSKVPVGQRSTSSNKRSRRKQKRATAEHSDDIEMVEIEEDGLNEADMMKMMGFSDFSSTKGKHIPGNDIYVANIVQKRKYRQYMNRRGGFNRPLDFVA